MIMLTLETLHFTFVDLQAMAFGDSKIRQELKK